MLFVLVVTLLVQVAMLVLGRDHTIGCSWVQCWGWGTLTVVLSMLLWVAVAVV